MKTLIFAVLMLLSPSALFAKQYFIAISPFQDKETAEKQVNYALQFIMTLNGGDSATVLDGYHLTQIAELNIPDNPSYNSPRARLNVNRQAVVALSNYVEAVNFSEEGAANIPHEVRLPQLLRHIATSRAGEGEIDVIVLGSLIYDDPADPAFSMNGGAKIPSDKHLLVGRRESPFGTQGQTSMLAGMRVHLAYPGASLRYGDQYAFLLERFLALHISLQGGVLVSFMSDVETMFTRVKSNPAATSREYEVDEASKLEMQFVQSAPGRISIFKREVALTPPSSSELASNHQVELGLSWDCLKCDVDLYTSARPGGSILHYSLTEAPEGRYEKDFQTSALAIHGFETVDFVVPVNLHELQIVINHYGGEAPEGVTGEIRLAMGGKTYAMRYSMTSTMGNGGTGVMNAFSTNKANAPQVLVINPLSILGVSEIPYAK